MKSPLLLVLLCLALGAPARAGSALDAPRAEAQAARTRVRELRAQQQALSEELNILAGTIERLKATQKNRLVAPPELDAALRRSQELSGQLTTLAQSLAGAEPEAERRNLALYTALSEELTRVRAAWDGTTDREARAGLLARMKVLRAERDAVRSALPPSRVPAFNPADPSEDSAELLEQADALRDSEDKVHQRLRALHARLEELREERELDRRMSDFLGEESMFDEQDRRLRLRIDSTTKDISVEGAPRTRGGVFPSPQASFAGEADSSASPAPTTGPPGTATPPATGAGAGGTSRASDNRPQVGAVRAQSLASAELEDAGELEREAARLEALARELDARATTLERRAHELR